MLKTQLDIYIDGASKGNPGPSGIGIVIYRDGMLVKNISNYLGIGTNNTAEYTALIYGLQEALILKADCVRVNSDSELLCHQMNKAYKVKNPDILKLYHQAIHLISGFKSFTITHINRENNRGADKLANKAIRETQSLLLRQESNPLGFHQRTA